jgi:hypothetical protein
MTTCLRIAFIAALMVTKAVAADLSADQVVSGTVFRDVKGFAEAKGLGSAENADKIIR